MALIDRVKYDAGPNEIVWKYPAEDLSTATQCIVNESQEVIFYKSGEARDILGPGRHTLSTNNIPILEHLINLPFGGKTPFTAEVYYVNKIIFNDLKWGTQSPIQVQDPKYSLFVPVRSFGTYGIRVIDSKTFISTMCGTLSRVSTEDVTTYLKSTILTRVGDFIAETIIKQKTSIVEVSMFLEEVSAAGKARIAKDFEKYGLEVTDFLVNSINVPEDDPSVQRLKKALSDRAEMDILGDRYVQKRTFDAMDAAASNPGGANTMGAGLGMGMGVSMGNSMAGMMSHAMNSGGNAPQSPAQVAFPTTDDVQQKLAKLESLKNEGLLTEEEFAAKKQQLMPAKEDDVYAKIRKLASLKDEGLLTEEEFQTKKKALLDQI